jgi:hypothetical protein
MTLDEMKALVRWQMGLGTWDELNGGRTMTFTFDATIYRDEDELELRVTYKVSPYYPETRLQPAEGGDVEILEAKFIDTDCLPAPLTDGEYDSLQVIAEARAPYDAADAAADHADYLYEQHRDRMMEAKQ